MVNTQQRIEAIIEFTQLTAPEFAKSCGFNTSTIYNYLHGKTVSHRNMNKIIARYPEISETWLYTGRGPMFVPKKLNDLDKHLDFYSAMRIIEYTEQNLQTIETEIKEMRKSMHEFIEKFKIAHKLPE
jgi:DNA-binding transcriptional regulator YiaG